VSTPVVVMSKDDVESSVILAPGTRTHLLLGVGFHTAGTNGAFLYYNGDNSNWNFIQQTSWGAGWTNVSTAVAGPTCVTGDKVTIRRIGNQYFAIRNGKQVITWIDTGNVIVRDANNRIPALGIHTDGTNYRDYDAFDAAVIVGDNFNRADAGTLGAGWTQRWGQFGISGNLANPVAADWNIATPVATLSSNDFEISVTVGVATGGGGHILIGGGLSSIGEGAFLYTDGSGGWNIFRQYTWDAGNWGGVASVSNSLIPATSSTLTFRRIGNTYYTIYEGEVQVSWVDSGNVIPRDANHRLVELGEYSGSGAGYWPDTFSARSL
jgi:hypothetical protein